MNIRSLKSFLLPQSLLEIPPHSSLMSLPLLTLVAVESQAESQLALPAVVFAVCFDVFKSPPHALKYPN